jgi:hypothetical protein
MDCALQWIGQDGIRGLPQLVQRVLFLVKAIDVNALLSNLAWTIYCTLSNLAPWKVKRQLMKAVRFGYPDLSRVTQKVISNISDPQTSCGKGHYRMTRVEYDSFITTVTNTCCYKIELAIGMVLMNGGATNPLVMASQGPDPFWERIANHPGPDFPTDLTYPLVRSKGHEPRDQQMRTDLRRSPDRRDCPVDRPIHARERGNNNNNPNYNGNNNHNNPNNNNGNNNNNPNNNGNSNNNRFRANKRGRQQLGTGPNHVPVEGNRDLPRIPAAETIAAVRVVESGPPIQTDNTVEVLQLTSLTDQYVLSGTNATLEREPLTVTDLAVPCDHSDKVSIREVVLPQLILSLDRIKNEPMLELTFENGIDLIRPRLHALVDSGAGACLIDDRWLKGIPHESRPLRQPVCMYSFKLEKPEDSMVITHGAWLKYFLEPLGPFETCFLRSPRPINSPILGRDFIQQGDFWLDLNRAQLVTSLRKNEARKINFQTGQEAPWSYIISRRLRKGHLRVFDETVNSKAVNLDALPDVWKVEVVHSSFDESGRSLILLQGVTIHLQPMTHYLFTPDPLIQPFFVDGCHGHLVASDQGYLLWTTMVLDESLLSPHSVLGTVSRLPVVVSSRLRTQLDSMVPDSYPEFSSFVPTPVDPYYPLGSIQEVDEYLEEYVASEEETLQWINKTPTGCQLRLHPKVLLPKGGDPTSLISTGDLIRTGRSLTFSLKVFDGANDGLLPGIPLTDFAVRIPLTTEEPVCKKLRMTGPKDQELLRTQLQEDLQNGIIRPSRSPYGFNYTWAPKSDGTLRFCVKYKPLNDITVKDKYPLTRMEDVVHFSGKHRYLSVVDCKLGFHNLAIHPDCRHKTAFLTPAIWVV